jgi:hypothetical protein
MEGRVARKTIKQVTFSINGPATGSYNIILISIKCHVEFILPFYGKNSVLVQMDLL